MHKSSDPELETAGGDTPIRDDFSSEEKYDETKDEVQLASTPSYYEPVVGRKELWSYYLYVNGNNSIGPAVLFFNLFQSLVSGAGYDPVKGPGSSCSAPDASGKCLVQWGHGTRDVSSIVLMATGISFALMASLFTTIGSIGDYGSCGRWLLLGASVFTWATQFASLSLTTPSRWPLAMVLYILGFAGYGASEVFYVAIFPRLARNMPTVRSLREKFEAGEIEREVYEKEQSFEKNHICSISTAHSNIGYIAVLLLGLAVLYPLGSNSNVNNYVIVLTNAYCIVTGIWWFIYQQPRPGPPLPKGSHYLTIGWKQVGYAVRQYKKLPYTFIYLFSCILLADGLNTTGTLVSIQQNDKIKFSFLENTYLNLAQAVPSAVSTFAFWYTQKYWKISTRTMFIVVNVFSTLIPLWGMIGIWSEHFGFKNVWEFWAYNVVFGLFQAPYYAYSQTIMAELTPPGFDNMFFGLFCLSNRASSMIGPNVIQVIVDKTGNSWNGYPFLFGICLGSSLIIWFAVDIKKGRQDAVAWAEERRSMVEDAKQS